MRKRQSHLACSSALRTLSLARKGEGEGPAILVAGKLFPRVSTRGYHGGGA